MSEAAQEQAQEIQAAVISSGEPADQLQLRFAFAPYPTELTRTSPFFPMSTQEMSAREYIKDMEIASHSWGTLNYSGPKLSVYEEDYLMILLALLCDTNSRTEEQTGEGTTTYTYHGSIRQILKLKGIDNPGANHYQATIDALTLLAGASFRLTTTKSEKRGKGTPNTTYINNILSNIKYQHGSGDIAVTVNPYFYESYAQGMVTWLDVRVRAQLKSLVSKALFRFVKSHRDDAWVGPLLTLAASLNLDMDLPKIKLRERIRKAIGELVSTGILLPTSHIDGDTVQLHRAAMALDTKKHDMARIPKIRKIAGAKKEN